MTRLKIITILMLGSLFGCHYFRDASEKPDTHAFNLAQVQKELRPLKLNTPYKPTKEIKRYFQFYHLDPPQVTHYFGTVVSENHTLVAHLFIPENPKGTLFLLHGYFDHSGTYSKLIHQALSNHYAVVSWDLPGHGLSSGERTDLGDFKLCAEQVVDLVQRTKNKLPAPFYLIAHSTGCSIAMEYMNNAPSQQFEKIIFLAPLVHHQYWACSKVGYFLAKPFIHTLRRVDKKNSSDPDYLAFVKKDPLHSSTLSLEFLDDLFRWEKQIQNAPIWPGSVLIIQGDADAVIDWKYNLKFLRKKIQHPEIHLIHGARHQLCNENAQLRDQVFKLIFADLKTPAPSQSRDQKEN